MLYPYKNADAKYLYEYVIKKVCKEIKLEIKIAPDIPENRIPELLFNEIKQADVVIADATDENPNVFYELGISHTLDRNKTIIITQNDPKEVPIDIRMYQIEQYKKNELGLYSEFEKVLKQKIETILKYSHKQNLRIGIGFYPEMQLLRVAKKYNYFEDLNIEVKDLKWNEMYDHFNGDGYNVNVIIGNQNTCRKYNKRGDKYYFPKVLFYYDSFAILTRKELNLKPFEVIRNQSKNTNEAIRNTLSQLLENNLEIIASEDTDHFDSMKQLNSYFDKIAFNKRNVHGFGEGDDKDDPHECLTAFLERDEGDGFIGGIPERITAMKTGKVIELITEKDIPKNKINLTQRNGFVLLHNHYIKNPLFQRNIEILFLGWERICKEIKALVNEGKTDHNYFNEMTEEYNKAVSENYQNEFTNKITKDELVSIFSKKWIQL